MIHEELQRLEKLATQVSKKLEQIEEQNLMLKHEVDFLRSSIKEKDDALEDFKNQIKITKLVHSIPVENIESAELRERINNYIQEIDNIIAYLSE
jgi:predicted  nucleic acid-binding Zn-ribbon protein